METRVQAVKSGLPSPRGVDDASLRSQMPKLDWRLEATVTVWFGQLAAMQFFAAGRWK